MLIAEPLTSQRLQLLDKAKPCPSIIVANLSLAGTFDLESTMTTRSANPDKE